MRVLPYAATILLLAGGCRSSVPDMKPFEGLKLTATLPRTQLHIGEEVLATVTMLNTTRDPVSGCLGQSKGFHIFGTTADRGSLEVVDHESCATPFHLSSGQSISWPRPIFVEDVGIGPARLSVFMKVVSEEGFSPKYGAYSRGVSTGFIPLQILPAEEPR